MPNIVAARPVAGASIDSAWGGEVHDRVEAVQLVQTGRVTIVFSGVGSASLAGITFPIPFASAPVVVTSHESGSTMIPAVGEVTATSFTAWLRHYNSTATTATLSVGWMAVGTAVGG